MITHYGLFWNRDDIFWGRQKNPAKLQGREEVSPKAKTHDYRDYKGVYALFSDGDLTYVGQAGLARGQSRTIFDRISAHHKDQSGGPWNKFCWFGVDKDTSIETDRTTALSQLEAVCIAITNPGHNKKSGGFAGAKRVYQVPHEEAEGGIETQLGRMKKQLDRIEADIEPNEKSDRAKNRTKRKKS